MLAASPDLARAVGSDRDLQRQMCDPTFNPDAAAFFTFNFCMTQDEERQGRIGYLPPAIWGPEVPKLEWHGPGEPTWCLKAIEALDAPRPCLLTGRNDPHNVHVSKARRKLWTWLAMHYNLWALQWVRGYSSILISKSEDHVDDAGKQGTKVFSMFSRMRFAWERLPDHARKHIDWTFMSGVCPENDAWTLGRAPTIDAGRGAGAVRAFVDECAFIEYMMQIHAALDPACKFGKVYWSSENGPDTQFAQIEEQQFDGWRFVKCDWKEDPGLTEGIRETRPGLERERYGTHVSPRFVQITASLTDEVIAQEYLRDRNRSTTGMVIREFIKDVHVRTESRGGVKWDPGLETRMGLDPGHARKCAATLIQPVAMERCRVIGSWEGVHRSSPQNAQDLVPWVRDMGYRGALDELVVVPDPAAFNEEIGSGLEVYSWYRAVGFEHYELPRILGPDSVFIGCNVLRGMFLRNMVEMDERNAKTLIRAIPAYRLPVDRRTNEITSNKPVHNMASHPVDSFRYPVVSIWTADDLPDLSFDDLSPPVSRRVEKSAAFESAYLSKPFERKERDPGADDGEFDEDEYPIQRGGTDRLFTSSLEGRRF